MKGTLEILGLRVAFRRRAGLWHRETVVGLDDIRLAARPGELLALVGTSGAGKSLLVHAVLGLLPPNALVREEMRLDGRPLDARAKAALRGRRIALVPQSLAHLDPLAPIGRQLRWAARRSGGDPDVAATLRSLGLPPETGRLHPGAVSGGMARRILLAAALASPADIFLADEPTDGLDPENAALVLARLRALADAGRTVLVVTHDLSAILPHAERVAVLREGRIVSEERAADFTGSGERLRGDWSRRLWRALPQNDFQGSLNDA